MRHRLVVAIATALAAQAAGADGLADLRACLARLPAHDPVRATVSVEVRPLPDPKAARDAPKQEPVAITVEAAASAGGVTVTAPAELIAAVRDQRRPGRGGKRPVNSLEAPLQEVRFDAVEGRLDAGRGLAAQLADATLLREAPDTYRGDPARLVIVRPASEFDEEARKHVKELKEEVRIWIDGGGCPLASEATMDGKFRFLVFSAEAHLRSRLEYARYGDRLIAVREEREERGSGMGQHSENATTVAVVPHPPEAAAAPAPTPAGRDERR
jgi:hypothetical protein